MKSPKHSIIGPCAEPPAFRLASVEEYDRMREQIAHAKRALWLIYYDSTDARGMARDALSLIESLEKEPE